ncbi:MAG: hypothetical protein QXH03_00270 [Candidatus Bathyarchaeia archaeon]
MEEKERLRITKIKISQENWLKFRALAIRKGKTIQELLGDLIKRFLEEEGEGVAPDL